MNLREGWGGREHYLALGLGVATIALVSAIVPGLARAMREAPAERQEIALLLPPQAAAAAEPAATARKLQVVVMPGQTLGGIFRDLGLSDSVLQRLLAEPGLRSPLTRIRAGQEFEFELSAAGALVGLGLDKDDATRLALRIDPQRIEHSETARAVQRRTYAAAGVIAQSLFAAGQAGGLPDDTLLELANLFAYDIDFAQDIRTGDRFEAIYEEVWREGERLRTGGIVAATFVNQGKRYQAFRYVRSDGREDYYDAEGRPIRKSFLRMPIEFARISSRFNPNRRHPVLGFIRAHKGVDYAANIGTPIRAAGDGRVGFEGWKGGYGRAVILDHGRGYTTLYGHMSRFGRFRPGSRVRQGEVIGFVGKSGLATGPHLHYEFRVKGVHRDPLKVTLPKPEPLPAVELARFTRATAPMRAQLQLLAGRRLAMAR